MKKLSLSLSSLLVLLCCLPAFGQGSGTIAGKVTTADGEGIPAVSVDAVRVPHTANIACGKGTLIGLPNENAVLRRHGGATVNFFTSVYRKPEMSVLLRCSCFIFAARQQLEYQPRLATRLCQLNQSPASPYLIVDYLQTAIALVKLDTVLDGFHMERNMS